MTLFQTNTRTTTLVTLCVSHSGEAFVLQPGFDLRRRGGHVQSRRRSDSAAAWLWRRAERLKGRGDPAGRAAVLKNIPANRPRLRCSSLSPGLSVERCLHRRAGCEQATTVWTFGSPAERKNKKVLPQQSWRENGTFSTLFASSHKKISVLACFCWTSNIWKETTRRSHWLEPTPGEGVELIMNQGRDEFVWHHKGQIPNVNVSTHTFWKAQQAKEVFLMLEISKASFKMTWQYFRHKLTLKNCSVLHSVNKPFHSKMLKLKDA